MLTPAEELGLSGLSLASRLRRAFQQIPDSRMVEIVERIRQEAFRRHLVYLRDGQPDAVQMMASPVTMMPDQLMYVHYVTQTIQNALKRLPDLYLENPDVRSILRLPPDEERWLLDCWNPAHRENNPVFGRYDAVLDSCSPMWKNTLHFLEPNMSGIGGLHMVPTADGIICDVVLPEIRAQDPQIQLEAPQDIRRLLMQDLLDHLEALERPGRNICLIEPKYATSGPDEQQSVARYCHDQFGINVMHADPAELTLKGDDVFYEGTPVDLVYRDYALPDLLELERAGVDIRPVRLLFQQNRIVSSIAAELDQKSCWEVLTDPQITARYFSADDRQVFRRHVLWTRVLGHRKTVLPGGQTGELLDYVRRERETLVLKPNRGYGGRDVAIGPAMTPAEWEAALEKALADKERSVVQELANIPAYEFPVIGPDGRVHVEPFYVVLGFAPSKYGVSILGRASQKQVVNVAQRGGMCSILLGVPPERLIGPGEWRSKA